MEIDPIRLSKLRNLYGKDRSAVYPRLKDLQIEPIKQNRLGQSRTDNVSTLVQDNPGPIIPIQTTALVTLVETLLKRLVPTTGDRLSYLRELEEAYEKGWLLSTSELAALLSLSPKTLPKYGQEFHDAGFIFTRAGTRKRGEIAWAISKVDNLDIPINTSEIT